MHIYTLGFAYGSSILSITCHFYSSENASNWLFCICAGLMNSIDATHKHTLALPQPMNVYCRLCVFLILYIFFLLLVRKFIPDVMDWHRKVVSFVFGVSVSVGIFFFIFRLLPLHFKLYSGFFNTNLSLAVTMYLFFNRWYSSTNFIL